MTTPRKPGRPRAKPAGAGTESQLASLLPRLELAAAGPDGGAPRQVTGAGATPKTVADAVVGRVYGVVKDLLEKVDDSTRDLRERDDLDPGMRAAIRQGRSTRDLLVAANRGDPAALGILRDLSASVSDQILQETRNSVQLRLGLGTPGEHAAPVLNDRNDRAPTSGEVSVRREDALQRLTLWLLNADGIVEPGGPVLEVNPETYWATPPAPEAEQTVASPKGRRRGNSSGGTRSANTASAAAATAAAHIAREATDFLLHTGQEMDAYLRAAADGRSGSNWHTDDQAGTRTHHIPGLSHYVRMELTTQERALGANAALLEDMTGVGDAAGMFALLYVSRLLAPPAALPGQATSVDWVDLDDVADKIGLQPGKLSAEQRLEVRRRVWGFLNYGSRARVVGSRTGVYRDKATGEAIQTQIDAPLWSIQGVERPRDGEPGSDVPRRVEVAMSRDWLRLITNPQTAQYLPMGELLGAIPPGKPSGAWARVIGLSLANTWRRRPREAIAGDLTLTRRELLSRYAAPVAPYEEVLGGPNPKRAIVYWAEALVILAEQGFLEREGEAAPGVAQKGLGPDGRELPRKGWQSAWLDAQVRLRPGPAILAAVEVCAESLPSQGSRRLPSARGGK